MAWIRTVGDGEATGRVAAVFAAARARAGRVFHILRTMSLSPEALDASMGLYLAVMKRPSALSRARRELLATVVSKTNGCHY
jgi:alkylhydroperoxidase family enzyme